MKIVSPLLEDRPADFFTTSGGRKTLSGFTLIEMLTVVAIIGILVGLVAAAAVTARNAAKRATIKMDLSQLEMACQQYKAKFGEYPPDFADVTTTTGQAIILRHLAKAFPRYQTGISTGTATGDWAGFVADVSSGWGLPLNSTDSTYLLSPATALTFWLGGCPQWLNTTTPLTYPPSNAAMPVQGFIGFSANPLNPFDNSPSRISPFYDFSLTSLDWSQGTRSGTPVVAGGLMAWSSGACDKTRLFPLVYFRSENGNYTIDGLPLADTMSNAKCVPVTNPIVWPAIDRRLSTPAASGPPAVAGQYTWVNPSSVQIFCAGLGCVYAAPYKDATMYPSAATYGSGIGPYEFPTGTNYQPDTYDDITNFSTGTLEESIK